MVIGPQHLTMVIKTISCAEFSPKFVEFTTERVASLGLEDRISTEVADATNLSKFKVRMGGGM